MKWEFRVDPTLVKRLSEEAMLSIEEAAQEMAEYQIANVQLRAASGVGSDDRPMKPYSRGYAKKRADSGRDASKRTLNWSGRMLRSVSLLSISTVGQQIIARLGLSGFEAQKAEWNEAISPWFQLSPGDRTILLRVLERRLRQRKDLS